MRPTKLSAHSAKTPSSFHLLSLAPFLSLLYCQQSSIHIKTALYYTNAYIHLLTLLCIIV